jgi:hypothetical protein
MKVAVYLVILIFGGMAYRRLLLVGGIENRRKAVAWGVALVGAFIGSGFGIAGYGDAISGRIPGAILGYALGSYWVLYMKYRYGAEDGRFGVTDHYRQGGGEDECRSAGAPPVSSAALAAPPRRIVVPCIHCGQKLRVPEGLTLDIKCPKCRSSFHRRT